jgi:glycerophosphoryl diester phosphodiesterase
MTLENLPAPILFAHRGSKAHAPENTLASFRLAVEQRADAIELDVKLTRDGYVVVLHDQTVDRTTNGHANLSDLTLEEVKRLDAGSFFGAQYAGEQIPTLDEVFVTVGKQVFINVELTNYATPRDRLVEKVAQIIRRHGQVDNVLFSSFLSLNLLSARRLLPDVPVGYLANEGLGGAVARSTNGQRIAPHIIHPYVNDATDDFVRKQHAIGRRVHVWTVNDPKDMQRLFNLGIEGIFTDDPLLARSVLESTRQAAKME